MHILKNFSITKKLRSKIKCVFQHAQTTATASEAKFIPHYGEKI